MDEYPPDHLVIAHQRMAFYGLADMVVRTKVRVEASMEYISEAHCGYPDKEAPLWWPVTYLYDVIDDRGMPYHWRSSYYLEPTGWFVRMDGYHNGSGEHYEQHSGVGNGDPWCRFPRGRSKHDPDKTLTYAVSMDNTALLGLWDLYPFQYRGRRSFYTGFVEGQSHSFTLQGMDSP